MANYDQYKILTRKNTILSGGIKNVEDENAILTFDNMRIQLSNQDDPTKIVIPTIDRTLEILKELKDISANVLYKADIVFEDVLPDSDVLNQLYNSTSPDEALFVQDIVTNKTIALSSLVKNVTVTNPDGTTETFVCQKANLNEGILYTVKSNGIFETAVFTAAGWQLDKSKNTTPERLNSLNSEIVKLQLKDTSLDSDISSINARLSEQGVFLTQANVKSVSGKGTIALSGTPTDGDKLPIRSEVGSMGATLQNNITTVEGIANSASTTATAAQTSAGQALAKAIDAEQTANSVSGTASTAAQDAHDAKIAAAKATDAITKEISDRTAADTTLQSNIDTLTSTVAGKQSSLTDAQKLVINGIQFTSALKTEYDGYEARITANRDDIDANKAILDTTKAQSDLDHADVAALKTDLVATTNKAQQAYDLGQDWNTEKVHIVRRDELNTSATILGNGRGFVRVGTSGDIYECILNTAFNGNPAMDFSTISGHPKAIAGITRPLTVDGISIVRTNSLSDPKWSDDTAEGTDTIYLASDLTAADKTANVATIKINATKITVDFTNGLTAGQREVFLKYTLAGIEFIDTGASQVSAADTVARNAANAAQTTANTAVAGLNTKQATLTSDQMAILAGVPFTSGLKTKYDGYLVAISGKQDRLSAAQLSVVNGKPFTQALNTELTDIGTVNVRDISANTEHTFALKDFSGMVTSKAYVDAKVASAGIPATVTTDLTQLKGVKVQKNGADLSTAQVTLSALTSADLLVDKTYADAIVAGKQNSTLTSTIAGATTVVGALTSINANVAIANGDIATLKTSVNGKQNATDNSLTTTSKNIAGAINEINTWKTSATTELNKLSIDNTKLLELKTALGL